MNIYLEILIAQCVLFLASIAAVFYFRKIPTLSTLKQATIKIPVWYVLIGFLVWLLGYARFSNLTYVLGTGWFLALFITGFLLLYTRYSLRLATIISLFFAFTLTLLNYLLNSYYTNNFYMLFGIIGVAALFVKYLPLSYKRVAIISGAWLLYDIASVLIFPNIILILLEGAETTAFKNAFILAQFQIGSGDIFFILVYTLFTYKTLGIKQAPFISALMIPPLLALPLLFPNQTIPYLAIIVPLFLIVYPLQAVMYGNQ